MAEINGRPTSPTAPLVLQKYAKTGEGAVGEVGGGTNAKRSPTFDSLRGMGVVLVMSGARVMLRPFLGLAVLWGAVLVRLSRR